MAQYGIDWSTPFIGSVERGFNMAYTLAEKEAQKQKEQEAQKQNVYKTYIDMKEKGLAAPEMDAIIQQYGLPIVYPKNNYLDDVSSENIIKAVDVNGLLKQKDIEKLKASAKNIPAKDYYDFVNKVVGERQDYIKGEKDRAAKNKGEANQIKDLAVTSTQANLYKDALTRLNKGEDVKGYLSSIITQRSPKYDKYYDGTSSTITNLMNRMKKNEVQVDPTSIDTIASSLNQTIDTELPQLDPWDKKVLLSYGVVNYKPKEAPGAIQRLLSSVGSMFTTNAVASQKPTMQAAQTTQPTTMQKTPIVSQQPTQQQKKRFQIISVK